MNDTLRTQTFSWQDPLSFIHEAAELSGLELLQNIADGEIPPPPMMVLMNAKVPALESGRVIFEAEPQEYHYNPIGSVHGGFAATMLDSAMGCAIHTMLPAKVGYTTLEIKVNYVRPLSANSGVILCEGNVIHLGGKIATAEGKITNKEGKLFAHATTTCLILR